MRVTHKVDYAVRAMAALAAADAATPGVVVTREVLAEQEHLPPSFLDDILRSMRNGGLVASQRGADGGWRLARPADAITVAMIIRTVEGPLAAVRGVRPHELPDEGVAEPFVRLWVATRAALRSVLDHVTIADLASGALPPAVDRLADGDEAWATP